MDKPDCLSRLHVRCHGGLPDLGMHFVRKGHDHQVCSHHGAIGIAGLKSIHLRPRPCIRTGSTRHHHLNSRIAQVEGVGSSLVAVAHKNHLSGEQRIGCTCLFHKGLRVRHRGLLSARQGAPWVDSALPSGGRYLHRNDILNEY